MKYMSVTGNIPMASHMGKAVILPEFSKVIFILVLVLLSFTLPPTASADGPIKIGGVGSTLGSMKMLAEAFEKSHPGQKVIVLPSLGSGGGIKAVSRNAIDIAVSSRALTEGEKKYGLSVGEYARTPLVFITRQDMKITNLSTAEIIKIYKGETQVWSDNSRIRLILRPASENDTIIMKGISPEMESAITAAASRPGIVIGMSDQENLDILERTPGGFGVSTLTQIIAEKRAVKIVSYNGVMPVTKNLVNSSYPIFKPFLIITAADISPHARNFLEFVRSPVGRKILETTGNQVMHK